jgi:hypothetical protein
MFCIKLDSDYLQRINKLNRLPDWQLLAETTIAQFNQSTH